MSVQDTRTVTIPQQAGPAEPPRASSTRAAHARPVGRDRPMDPDERQFAFALVAMLVFFTIITVVGMVLAQDVWS